MKFEAEIIRVSTRKFKLSETDVRRALNSYLAGSKRIEITGLVTGICRDPNDDHVLECAITAGAQILITGDKDLLTLGEFQGTSILSTRQYLELT